MDVLELPRPVINFLRTMSKEMNRYSLCWDIYGGSENVTLTLTWKINELSIENNNQQTKLNDTSENNNSTATLTQQVNHKQIQFNNPSVDCTKVVSQQQQKAVKSNLNKNSSDAELQKTRKDSVNKNDEAKLSDEKIVENIKTATNTMEEQQPKILNRSTNSLIKPCPPPSLAYIKRKSLNQKLVLSKQMSVPVSLQKENYTFYQQVPCENDPWIKRNETNAEANKEITAVATNLENSTTTNSENNHSNERKLSLQATDSYSNPASNQNKVKFDLNLHYI